MNYYETKEKLLASIDENDPYRTSKQQQIERWCLLYGNKLLRVASESKISFITKIFNDQECWKKTDSLKPVKLDRYVVGRKIIALKNEDGEGSPWDEYDHYNIACLFCVEEDIRSIFEKFKSKIGKNDSVEALVKRLNDNALMIFWSKFMWKQGDQKNESETSDQTKKLKLDHHLDYIEGFKAGVKMRETEAMKFFWQKLQVNLSEKEKEDLLIKASFDKNGWGDVSGDMIDFCLKQLDPSKYSELLKEDFQQNKYYSTLSRSICDYYFDNAQKLFKYLKPEDITYDQYDTLIYSILTRVPSILNNSLVEEANKMFDTMVDGTGFEEHRQYFLDNLKDWASNTELNTIILTIKDKNSKIISDIVSIYSREDIQYLKKVDEKTYNFIVESKLLNNSDAKRENGNILALSEDNNITMVGCNSSDDSSSSGGEKIENVH